MIKILSMIKISPLDYISSLIIFITSLVIFIHNVIASKIASKYIFHDKDTKEQIDRSSKS